jgi:hypothetical protein
MKLQITQKKTTTVIWGQAKRQPSSPAPLLLGENDCGPGGTK